MEVAALGLAAGTALAVCFRADSPAFWAAATLIGLAASLAVRRYRAVAVTVVLVLLGILRTATDASLPGYDGIRPPEGDAVVRGRLAEVVKREEGRTTLLLRPVRVRAGDRTWSTGESLRVNIYGAGGEYHHGDMVEARGRLGRSRGRRNALWPGTPQRRGNGRAAAVLHVSSPVWVKSVPAAAPFPLGPAALRERVIGFWERSGDPAAGLLRALTTGDRSAIGERDREHFYRSGLGHLIAVSGLHLGAVAAMVFFLCRFVLGRIEPLASRHPVQPLAAFMTVPALFFFALLTGGQVSAVRAALMASLFFAAIPLRRRGRATALIAAAATAMLFVEPALIANPSFQLSFAAVTVLALAGPVLLARLQVEGRGPIRRVAMYMAGLLATSSLIAVFTVPLTAFHFGSFSPIGPLANLVAIPLTVFVLLPLAWCTVMATILAPPLAALFMTPALLAGRLLIDTADFFSSFALSSLALPRPPPVFVAAAVVMGVVLLRRRGGRGTSLAAAVALSIMVICIVAGLLREPLRNDMAVAFLDVGQGEAALFRMPGGKTMLVDTGPAWSRGDAGRYIVAPALRRLGVRTIDYLVITHSHPDHAGGLAAILETFPVGELWWPRLDGPDQSGSTGPSRESELPLQRFWKRGDRLVLEGGTAVRFLNPPWPPYRGGERAVNDNSLVFTVTGPSLEVLMTGDAGERPLAEIVSLLEEDGGSRAVKVPHHGALQGATKELASRYRPDYAVISVGRNRYGHPDPSTEQAYAGAAEVLRTDIEGAVFIEGRDGGAESRTWLGDSLGDGGMVRSLKWAFGMLQGGI